MAFGYNASEISKFIHCHRIKLLGEFRLNNNCSQGYIWVIDQLKYSPLTEITTAQNMKHLPKNYYLIF